MLSKRPSPVAMVWVTVLGIFGSLSAGQPQGSPEQTAAFSLEGENYSTTLPEGFCLPTEGKMRTAFRELANVDNVNITHFTAIRCSDLSQGEGLLSEWIMMKTPRRSLGKRIPTRAGLVGDFRKQMDGDLQKLLKDPVDDANERMNRVFGAGAVQLGKLEMKPVDVDENAGFVAGTMDISVGGATSPVAGVFALTRVKRHLFFYYRYTKIEDKSDLANLLAKTLQLTKGEVRGFIENNPE